MADPDRLTPAQREQSKRNSIVDGSAYSVMYGFGEQYIVPFAIKLGATNSQIGILSSVPSFLGALFQIVGAQLTDHWRNRKKIVTLFVFFQALTLLPLFIVPFLTKNVGILTIIFILYMVFGNIVGPAWSSWIGDVVKEEERAKYFGKRNRIVVTSMMSSVLIAGIILEIFTEINIWIGFLILFNIAFIGRMVSAFYLSRQFEPKYEPPETGDFSFREFIRRMPRSNFGNFVLYRSLMAFAVMIAAPFFAVYVLKNLGFNYIQFTVMILVPMAAKILTMTYWGRYSDKFGSKNIMIVSGILISTVPLMWFISGLFFEQTNIIFYLILFAEAISGFAWAGFELTTFNYMLETVSSPKRAKGFAYFNVVFGTAVLMGGLLGSWLVSIIPALFGIATLLTVFFISFVLRSIIAFRFTHRMKEVRIETNIDEKKLFFDLVLAKPWNGALHQTASIMTFAEQEITVISDKTRYAMDFLAEPVLPVIKKIADFIDDIFEKIEQEMRKETFIPAEPKRKIYKNIKEKDEEGYLILKSGHKRKNRGKNNGS